MKVRPLCCLLLILFLVGCSSKQTTPADAFSGRSANDLFTGGEYALTKRHYEKAIKQFEALDALYPFSEYQEQGQLNLIYAYYKHSDFAEAAVAAVRFTRIYPRSTSVDYAYYMKGLANFNQDRGVFQRYIETDLAKRDMGTSNRAYSDFAELIRRFPNSPYAPDARNRMIYLRNLMARRELLVAEFYYERRAYLAAINRCYYILKHYQHAPVVIPALGLMVEAYGQLNMPVMAKESLTILAYNYPESQTYQALATQYGVELVESQPD